jgi:hypothetical protein
MLVLARILTSQKAIPEVLLDSRLRGQPVAADLASIQLPASREQRQVLLGHATDGGCLGERDEFLAVQVAGQ